MTLVCSVCGGYELAVLGGLDSPWALVIKCNTCRAEAKVVGLDVMVGGERVSPPATPRALLGFGQDDEDPWVPYSVRMKRSQRDVIEFACANVRVDCGVPEGPLTVGRCLELLAADYNSGSGGMGA